MEKFAFQFCTHLAQISLTSRRQQMWDGDQF